MLGSGFASSYISSILSVFRNFYTVIRIVWTNDYSHLQRLRIPLPLVVTVSPYFGLHFPGDKPLRYFFIYLLKICISSFRKFLWSLCAIKSLSVKIITKGVNHLYKGFNNMVAPWRYYTNQMEKDRYDIILFICGRERDKTGEWIK